MHFGDVLEDSQIAPLSHRTVARDGLCVGHLQQARGDVPAIPIRVALATEAIIRPEPTRLVLRVQNVADPAIDLLVDVHIETAARGIARRVQHGGERHHAIEPVRTALMPRARVIVRAADPHRVVHVIPEQIQVPSEAVGHDDQLLAQPASRCDGAKWQWRILERQQSVCTHGRGSARSDETMSLIARGSNLFRHDVTKRARRIGTARLVRP
jgi:hypothetical protein